MVEVSNHKETKEVEEAQTEAEEEPEEETLLEEIEVEVEAEHDIVWIDNFNYLKI